jgi:hypothetical protein
MVECCGIESDDLEISSVMLFMAFFAKFSADGCVIPFFLFYPRINFRMALQTFVIGKRFTDGMARGTIFNTFPSGMAGDKFSGRNLGKR